MLFVIVVDVVSMFSRLPGSAVVMNIWFLVICTYLRSRRCFEDLG